jgi:hypothetical protein
LDLAAVPVGLLAALGVVTGLPAAPVVATGFVTAAVDATGLLAAAKAILASGACEHDGHPGRYVTRSATRSAPATGWITRDINLAVRLGELPPDTDAEQLTFELHAIILPANHNNQLLHRPDALQRARFAIEQRLPPRPCQLWR